MKRWTVLRLKRSLAEHAAAWDTLNASICGGHPMLDSRFVNSLLQHFGNGAEYLCTYHMGGKPLAMCVLRRRGLAFWTSFLPAQAQIGSTLIAQPELAALLFRDLPGLVGQIDFLCHDPNHGDLSIPDNRGRQRESTDHALTINIRLDGDFAQYWAARPKKLVQNMARYQRRINAEQRPVEVVVIAAQAELATAVRRYGELESAGWKGKAGTALGGGGQQRQFYMDVMRNFAAQDGAAAYELWIDGRLAASRLTITRGSIMVMLKTTYDETLAHLAPGRLLLRNVVSAAFEQLPGGRIEFCTDADADLLAWSTGERWVQHVTVYRNSLFHGLPVLRRAMANSPLPNANPSTQYRVQQTVEVYRHPREFPGDVQRLFAATEELGVDSSLTWYSNLVDTVYPDHPGVHFYVTRQTGRPVAALPVLVTQARSGNQASSLSNFYTALYTPVLARDAGSDALLPLVLAVSSAHAPVTSFRFAPMDPDSHAYRCLAAALRAASMPTFHFYGFGNWYLQVSTDWTAYLAGRDGKLRNTIKRTSKKFAADGGSVEIVQGGPELERAIAAFEQVYAASWKTPEPFPLFIPGLIRSCAQRGWLRLGIARLGDLPIAAQIWIVANGKADIYKLAYDERHKTYAAGTILSALLMQQAIDKDKVREVDYLIGDDPYKQSWMSNRRERWGLIAYNSRTIAGVAGWCIEVLGRMVQLLKAKLRPVASGQTAAKAP